MRRGEMVTRTLPLLTALLAGGVGMLTSYFLGCILVGATLAAVWFLFRWARWIPSRRNVEIVGYGVILGLCIILGLYAPRGKHPSVPDSSTGGIVSYGQSGGVTAMTITNPTINNYFTSQPRSEREKWQDYLTQKYPLGWLILAADGTTLYTPRGLSYERDLVVQWGTRGNVTINI